MKGFHKNSRRIENEVFILYMPDHELVTASNFQKKIPIVSNFPWNIYGISMNRINPYSMVFTWGSSLRKSPRGLSWSMIYIYVSSFVCFEKSIDQFRFFLFLLILFRSRCIDPVHGLTQMCKSSICLCHSMSLFLFAYGIALFFFFFVFSPSSSPLCCFLSFPSSPPPLLLNPFLFFFFCFLYHDRGAVDVVAAMTTNMEVAIWQ